MTAPSNQKRPWVQQLPAGTPPSVFGFEYARSRHVLDGLGEEPGKGHGRVYDSLMGFGSAALRSGDGGAALFVLALTYVSAAAFAGALGAVCWVLALAGRG